MAYKRTYFPLTTASQRHLLFETWEATGNVALACQRAHVGRRTFYYWKPRFSAGGYAALDHCKSRARAHPPRIAPEVEQRVITARQHHPESRQPQHSQAHPPRRGSLDRPDADGERGGRPA